MIKGFWTCPNCETQNPIECRVCEVCDLERPDYLSPPEIVKFVSKSEHQVKRGKSVHLVWETNNSLYCFINGVRVGSSGEKDFIVEPQFVLKAKNNNDLGFAEESIEFAVLPNPEILEFSISRSHIICGESIVIRWATEDISEVILDGFHKYAPTGSVTLSPRVSCTYSFAFLGKNGEKIVKEISVSVTIPEPEINILSWPPAQCVKSSTSSLSWKSKFVDFVEFRGKKYRKDDSITLSLSDSIHDTLTFHGEDGNVYPRPLDIEVYDPIRIIECSKKLSLRAGEEGTISWTATNVDYVLIGSKKFGASGEYKIRALNYSNPTTRQYKLQFVSKYQTEERIVDVTSLPLPPVIKSLATDRQLYREGDLIRISWSSDNVKHVTLTSGFKTYRPDDSCEIPADTSKNSYIVIFHGADKSEVAKTVSVNVYPKPIIQCRVSKAKVNKKEECSISWNCLNVSKVVCDGVEYSGKDKMTFRPKETFTKWIDFYDLKGNLYSYESKTIEVIPSQTGCEEVFLWFLVATIVVCMVGAIGKAVFSSSTPPPRTTQHPPKQTSRPSAPTPTNTVNPSLDNALASYNRNLSNANVDNISVLESAYSNILQIENHRSAKSERDKLKGKANGIKSEIQSTPPNVRNLPINQQKIQKINALLNKL